MTFVIGPGCIDHMDQSCVEVCPVDCIGGDPSVDRKFHIDPDGCIECGSCVSVCPNDAIYDSAGLPAAYRPFADIDATWHRDPERARRQLIVLMGAPGTSAA